jgi:hypothetical protein
MQWKLEVMQHAGTASLIELSSIIFLFQHWKEQKGTS